MRVSDIVQRFLVPCDWLGCGQKTAAIPAPAGPIHVRIGVPGPGQRRDLPRDHRGSQPRWAHWPRAACPTAGTPPVPPACTIATTTVTRASTARQQNWPAGPQRLGYAQPHKRQRRRLTAPQKAKQPPAHTAARQPKGTSGRLANRPGDRTGGRAPQPASRGRSGRPQRTQPDARGTSPWADDLLPTAKALHRDGSDCSQSPRRSGT